MPVTLDWVSGRTKIAGFPLGISSLFVKKASRPPVPRLSKDDRMLVAVRDELYGGSWDSMREDLKSRVKGKPHVYEIAFRLADRIEVDLGRIRRLQGLETRHKVNLSELIRTGGR